MSTLFIHQRSRTAAVIALRPIFKEADAIEAGDRFEVCTGVLSAYVAYAAQVLGKRDARWLLTNFANELPSLQEEAP